MTEPVEASGLHRKLVWLNFFRVVTVTVLLGGTAVVNLQSAGGAEGALALAVLYGIVIATYAASIGISLALRLRSSLLAVAYAQVAVDVGVAASVVALTGGIDSVFVFMFSLAVVNAAIALYRPGALAAGALAVLGYLAVVLLMPGLPPVRESTLFVHVAAFLLTAALASYLSEQFRSTGERLAERESDLAAITALHESIVQSMAGGLLTLDRAGRITFLNRAAEQMLGASLPAVRGGPAASVFPTFHTGAGRGEVAHANARGERLLLGYSVFPLVGREGAELGTAVIFQDLTRLREMEEAVARTERLADLGRVAAGLAHELRNPLASMSGSIELLRADAPAEGDARSLMDIVLREAGRLDRLVAEFLRFARPAPLLREATDLASVLDETLRVFEHDPAAAGLTLERELLPTPADCDPHQLRQVAWNLLLNAAQAQAGRHVGRIRVRCAPAPDGGAQFEVEDDGPGVPASERDRIFLPFHTTKERGTGLGLATVERIVDGHEGRITVESAPGGGARFTVRLPARRSAASALAVPG